ncbi:MAG TPA: hypothetical protein VGH87_14295 [Polyangiaceae bacterium]|jgi:hypothetical protein|nr:hypothetical protein [Polyangiaceae bacterium]
MTRREKSLSLLKKLGFKVAPSLPTARDNAHVRPASEIGARFAALRERARSRGRRLGA